MWVAVTLNVPDGESVVVHVGLRGEALILVDVVMLSEDVDVRDRDCVIDMEGVIVHVGTCVHVTVVLGDAV